MQKVMALLAILFFMVCHPAVGFVSGVGADLAPSDPRYTATPCFLATAPPPPTSPVPPLCEYRGYEKVGFFGDGMLMYQCTPGADITVHSQTRPDWDPTSRYYRGFFLGEGVGPDRTDVTLLRTLTNVIHQVPFYGSCAVEFRCCESFYTHTAGCEYTGTVQSGRHSYGQWCPVTLKGPTVDYLGYKCSSYDLAEHPYRRCLLEPDDCTYVLDNEKQYINVNSCPDLLVPSDCQVKPFSGVPGDGDVKTIMCPKFTTPGESAPMPTGCYYVSNSAFPYYVDKCPVYPNPNGDKKTHVFCKDQPIGGVCNPPPPCQYLHSDRQYIHVSTCPDLAVPGSCSLKHTDTPILGGMSIDKCPFTLNPYTDSKAQDEPVLMVKTGCSYGDGSPGAVYSKNCRVYPDPKNDKNYVFCQNKQVKGECPRCKYISHDDGRQYIDVSSCPDLAVPWSCSLKDATDTSIPGGKSINQCPKYNVPGVHPQVTTGCSYGDGSAGTVYDKECLVYPDPKDEKSHVFCKYQPVDGKCQRCEYISHDGQQYINVSTCPVLAVPEDCSLKDTDVPTLGIMCPPLNAQGEPAPPVTTGCSYDGPSGTVYKIPCPVYPDPKNDKNHVFCKIDPAGGECPRCEYISHGERQYIDVSSCPDLAVPVDCTYKATTKPIPGTSIAWCPKYDATGVHPQVQTGCAYGDGSTGTVFTNVCLVYPDPKDYKNHVFCKDQPKKGVCPPP